MSACASDNDLIQGCFPSLRKASNMDFWISVFPSLLYNRVHIHTKESLAFYFLIRFCSVQ